MTWLDSHGIRRASDIAFGGVMLLVGALALWLAADYQLGSLRRLGPRFFPAVVAALLCIVAVAVLVRAALRRSPPVRRSRPLYAGIVAVVVVLFIVAVQIWGTPLLLRFGPAEFMAFMLLELAIAITLAHTSRSRAAGMALLGLLLSTVGTDVNSGVARFTMGLEALMDGISVIVVAAGVFAVADALVCLVSPALFLRTYTRLLTTWTFPRVPVYAALVMRLAAALAFAGACYLAYALSHSYFDVVLVLLFGALGVAAKILGWNRFLLYFGFALGTMLEENVRRALLLTGGDLSPLVQRPLGGPLLVAAMAILATATVLSVLRLKREAAASA